MTKIHFQNLRSKNFGFFFRTKNRKFEISIFLIDFSKKKISRKKSVEKYFSTDFFSQKIFLRKVNFKNENFKFSIFRPKNFQFFFEPKISKSIFVTKNYYFSSNFFSYKIWMYTIEKCHLPLWVLHHTRRSKSRVKK